ncbi:SRPBCC family protein [Parafrankia elaeagni]|uniref:SRPBCC family protein n=1 Tax=Parafrankia elaeagni TaxID=222534 RepID=UPI00037F96BF|nr:hypothetical protein [Parafrankia elaeagni]
MTMLIYSSDLPAPVPEVFRHCTSSIGFEQLFPYRVRWRSSLDRWCKGDLLHFRYRLAPGLWLTHRAEIVEYQENVRFVDEMAGGPYRLFRHVHLFEPRPGGGTRVIDHLQVTTRFGPLVDSLLCRVLLASTFRRRHAALEAHFAPTDGVGEAAGPSGAPPGEA